MLSSQNRAGSSAFAAVASVSTVIDGYGTLVTALSRPLSRGRSPRRLQRDAAQPARQREREVRERAVRAVMPPETQQKPAGSVVLRDGVADALVDAELREGLGIADLLING